MKRLIVLCQPLFISFYLQAQLPEDALRMSYTLPSGTAREQAIGGAMGSLGGDITANYINPAGLGFYKTSEVLVSPGWSFGKSNTGYLSNNIKSPSVNNFLLSTSGFVYGWASDPDKSSAISLAVNRTADFNGHIVYQGKNNYSSASDAYKEEFAASGISYDQAFTSPSLSYGTRMALYTYLIDTSQGGLGPIIAQPDKVLAAGGFLGQNTDIRSSGGITEIALGIAGSSKDKWYWGISIGIPIVNYQRTTQYTETDLSGDNNNDFGYYTYTETYSAKGVGVNGRFGAIFRPNLNWRFGLAVHTPTFYSITDRLSSAMTTNTEGYAGTISIQSDTLDIVANTSNSLEYDLQSPWHLLASGSYIFPGAVTEGKMGFITADIEYVANRDVRFSFPLDANGNQPDNSYFGPLNNTIKSYYKNTFNFRMGGEYKVNEMAYRLGASYSMNPYSSPDLKANRTTFSGGVGYRKKGIFIDLTYVEAIMNDVNFPYRLTQKDNYYSTVKQFTGNLILTFGIKF
ncbi:MAG TPA: hypothetical protein VGZ90_06225 [Puia sp.]|jgi:hypothetical protein|nr:hypothetical protein [Puia sp.]